MNEGANSTYPEDWRGAARRDWGRVKFLLSSGDGDLAGFVLQQCLEKYLKAFLLGHGWRLRKIHDLDGLLDAAAAFDPSLEKFRSLCERVADYYLASRYPILRRARLDVADVERNLSEARELIQALHPEEAVD